MALSRFNADQLDDLILLQEVRKLNPDFRLSTTARNRIINEFRKSRTNLSTDLNPIPQINESSIEHLIEERFERIEREIKQATSDLKREVGTDGYIAAILRWDIRLTSGKRTFLILDSNNES